MIFVLVGWGLAATTFPQAYPQYSWLVHVLCGLVASVAFLFGLLAHEVSHAIVAKRHGIEVDSITLWIFGGVAQLRIRRAARASNCRLPVSVRWSAS